MRVVFLLLATTTTALADVPLVEEAVATAGRDGWTITVTVRHADAGWDHYVDGWSVFAEDGAQIGHRRLAHPHVDEQPFTRSQAGIVVPPDTTRLTIRAHDVVHGWGPDFSLALP